MDRAPRRRRCCWRKRATPLPPSQTAAAAREARGAGLPARPSRPPKTPLNPFSGGSAAHLKFAVEVNHKTVEEMVAAALASLKLRIDQLRT